MKAQLLLLASAILFCAGPATAAPQEHGHGHDGHGHGEHGGQGEHAGGHEKKAGSATDKEIIAAQLPSYPLDLCVVSQEGLHSMGEPLDVVVEGRLLRLCCKGCVKSVKKSPAKAIAAVDAAVIKAQKATYPIDTCLISGEKLGGMGDIIDVVHGTRLARLCCKGCLRGFKKSPAKYMAKVDAALIAQQVKTYPISVCPISGEDLGSMDGVTDYLYGTRLVRLCCGMCKKSFLKSPEKTIAKLDAAAKSRDA